MISHLKRTVNLFLHSGNKYQCPFCGYKSKDFFLVGENIPVLKELNVIGGGLREAGCYKCKSSDRERLLFTYLFKKEKIQQKSDGLKILHIAPEKKLSLEIAELPNVEYLCGDLFTEGYNYGGNVIKLDIQQIPLEDNQFDIILCNHVLEHIEDDRKAMKELFRVLKKGGKAILQVPISLMLDETKEDKNINTPAERERNYGQFDHVRLYGKDYKQKLEESGFTVELINISNDFPKFGLNPLENLYIASK